MFDKIKKILNNEKGNVGFVYVIVIFLLMCLYMTLGGAETNISIMTVNEIKDILQTATPYAIREGISEDAHKNETILYNYDGEKAKKVFIDTILESLDKATFRSRIVYDESYLRNKLENYTTITTGSERWVNSWSQLDNASERKKIDFVTLTTVLPVEIKTTLLTSDVASIQEKFNKTNSNGSIEEGVINAQIDLKEKGMGAFIRFEMRVVLK